MPKLNLDKDFITRLNKINLSKSCSNLITESKPKPKPKPKFTISNDTTPFIPKIPKLNKIKPPTTPPITPPTTPITNTPSISTISSSSNNNPSLIILEQLNNKISGLERLMVDNIRDTDAMWNSFDDNIKKIVLTEIIDKYYMYKVWKINSSSFILGFLFAIIIILVFIIIVAFMFN